MPGNEEGAAPPAEEDSTVGGVPLPLPRAPPLPHLPEPPQGALPGAGGAGAGGAGQVQVHKVEVQTVVPVDSVLLVQVLHHRFLGGWLVPNQAAVPAFH